MLALQSHTLCVMAVCLFMLVCCAIGGVHTASRAEVLLPGMHTCSRQPWCMAQVWTWGEPWGDFSMNVNRHPRPVPGATNIAKIACGAFHNLAFSWYNSKRPGYRSLLSLSCFYTGHMALGSPQHRLLTASSGQAGRECSFVTCCCSPAAQSMITGSSCREGEVFAWGINDYGQLGDGSTSYATSPVKVVGLENLAIADVSAGGWHSLALTADGGAVPYQIRLERCQKLTEIRTGNAPELAQR